VPGHFSCSDGWSQQCDAGMVAALAGQAARPPSPAGQGHVAAGDAGQEQNLSSLRVASVKDVTASSLGS